MTAHGSRDTVAFRLWPPVAVGAPLVAGWLAPASTVVVTPAAADVRQVQ